MIPYQGLVSRYVYRIKAFRGHLSRVGFHFMVTTCLSSVGATPLPKSGPSENRGPRLYSACRVLGRRSVGASRVDLLCIGETMYRAAFCKGSPHYCYYLLRLTVYFLPQIRQRLRQSDGALIDTITIAPGGGIMWEPSLAHVVNSKINKDYIRVPSRAIPSPALYICWSSYNTPG